MPSYVACLVAVDCHAAPEAPFGLGRIVRALEKQQGSPDLSADLSISCYDSPGDGSFDQDIFAIVVEITQCNLNSEAGR
jgi:hypothetical protein